MAVVLSSAMQVTASGVHPNESEDLNNAEKGWVADTLNDFVAGFNIGMPLEDVLEDGSLVIWGSLCRVTLLRFLVWVPKGKSMSLSWHMCLIHRGRPWVFF
jgi:hypothetical protein